jgi:glycosyltransferase involved in cell wall biosynthesis
MKVGHASTFWPNGYTHTHYTDAIIRGMATHGAGQQVLLAEHPADPRDDAMVRCVPCYRRSEDFVQPLVTAAAETGAQVVLLQYSNDLFGEDQRFPRLIEHLEARGVRTVVNLHSVYPPDWRVPYEPGRRVVDFDRAVGRCATGLNVHSRRMRDDLVARGIDPAKITVIPHGSRIVTPLDKALSLRALGIPEGRRVVLFFGFVWLGKGLSFLLEVFGQVARRVPDAVFYLGGHVRKKTFYGEAYMAYLRAKVRALGFGSRFWSTGGYVPDTLVDTIYSASDVVALPYRQDYSSVSGVVHQAAGYGRLMLCSRISKFDEVGESISPDLLVGASDKRAWVERLTSLLTDQAEADRLLERVRRFAQKTSWDEVGRQHLELYRGILAGQAPADVQRERFPLEDVTC